MALKSKAQETQTENTSTTEETSTATTTEVATQTQAAPPELIKGGSVFITNKAFIEAAAGADYRTFPSITASNGTHAVSGSADELGKILKFQAIVAKDSRRVVPGSNDDEAKEYFQVSEDGKTVSDGRTIEEALEDAKEAGYEKASIKDYIVVTCLVVECENPDYIGEVVNLQLAPSSQFTWRPLSGKCKMRAAMGKLEASPVLGDESLGSAVIFTSTATPTTYAGNKFTKFEFSI